ncbi:DNA-binding transcriptional regulator, LysR family [Paenibacillus sp. UNCCL117]|uniref:LysR family transcriptional regulator n=1 Tax=unclassified Paenibacillus TaxID=185978 RepID=UPI0008822E76|nr:MULTISPECIES: LysR family transcriptional regulator [unclassified Paenibacillus]SDE28385.1 DNA-binding transcriptional regulator, LysR family [Paenibacillus sp. cl123]SFW63492.1 DNA-binding transcriptional regulator, LysR family [Paenibacillus sp. UNCCL117]
MEIRTIKTFQTIIRLGSFQRAAEELQYGQSTVTMHIQKLENDLGVKLLERGKKLKLTEAGRLFHQNADLLLKDYEYLYASMNELIQGEAGNMRLGVMEPTASYRLPHILGPFLQQHPKLKVSIQIGNTFILSQMLNEGIIDLAICSTPESGLEHTFEPLFDERLALLVPDTHRLAAMDRVLLRDLQHENILITTSVCPYRQKLESYLLENGGSPYTGMEIGNMAALKYYVQAGFGVAVVPVITATPSPPGTILKNIHDLDSGLVTGMLRKQNVSSFSSAAEKLVSLLRKELLAV